ncbi:nitrate transport permease nrtB [Acidihalobacter yilgarnensis]|uniref:Nitrate transport permease nrtB n=1 Tax=Acidihalobacter yilgarnensis TaxID=2819280 RepID=A0A1D8IRQ8_9GAMM|nr:ABC transporter permease [Acidihalobacter yilgarnensis]AOU99146.1 nitrate transport permease nrtB [Acidihalobacter yilgarnensis]
MSAIRETSLTPTPAALATAPSAGKATRPVAKGDGLWAVRGDLPRWQYVSIALFSFLLMLGSWWGLSDSGWVPQLFLPSPPQVVHRLAQWYGQGNLINDTQISIFRVTAGFVLSAAMAIPLGLYIGSFRPVQAFFEPMVEFARYLPAVAFVPLVLLWVGIGEGAKISIIWIGTFFQMVLMISENVRHVPAAQIEAAQTMGANRGEIVSRVIFRSALPDIVDTLRVTLGWAWTYLVVAEMVAANSGLGYAILQAQRFLQTGKIFGGILLIGTIGLIMDQLFRLLHRRAFPWLHRA